jgi:hypothetical protein
MGLARGDLARWGSQGGTSQDGARKGGPLVRPGQMYFKNMSFKGEPRKGGPRKGDLARWGSQGGTSQDGARKGGPLVRPGQMYFKNMSFKGEPREGDLARETSHQLVGQIRSDFCFNLFSLNEIYIYIYIYIYLYK